MKGNGKNSDTKQAIIQAHPQISWDIAASQSKYEAVIPNAHVGRLMGGS